MKKVTLVLLLLFPLFSFAQENDLPKIIKDTLFTTSGFKIATGEKIKIGPGTMVDGDFKYIRTNRASLYNYTSTTGYQAKANSANSFSRSNSGLQYKVVRHEKRGNKKHGYVYYTIINWGVVRYEIDVENAIASGEIVVPDEFKPKKPGATSSLSAADEIKKLKELLDAGAITQEEYEAGKKKILSQ